jgi:predicted RNA-binding Zn-ribbon protein involved in translation (DUF1610 family)
VAKILVYLFIAFGLVSLTTGQTSPKTQVADGSQYYSSTDVYGSEAEDVFKHIKNLAVRSPGLSKPTDGYTSIKSPVSGNFCEKGVLSRAYIYNSIDPAAEHIAQGIIVITEDGSTHKTRPRFNILYLYRNDVRLVAVPDTNGNGVDELAVIQEADDTITVRFLEFAGKTFVPLGSRQIYDINASPPFMAKLFASPGSDGKAVFSEERQEIVSGKGWTPMPSHEVKLEPDTSKYVWAGQRNAVMKHVIFGTFAVQMIAFVFLFILVIYGFFIAADDADDTESELPEKKSTKNKKSKFDLLKKDRLPTLEPINCKSCGAAVPLAEGEMTCPSCGTKTTAPADYFDVAKARNAIVVKIREAAVYLRRAKFLTSRWMRLCLALLVLWIGYSIVMVFVASGRENFAPYQDYLFGGSAYEAVTVFGSFTSAFWILSLGFAFLIWSPRVRKTLPKIDMGNNIGKAESAKCPQCGGGISYEADDLATVCGYCGVETYRAKLAWKLHDVTNTASEMAEFSLIEARRAAKDAVDDVVGTPKVFMVLLILMTILVAISWLVSAGYNLLPEGLRSFLDFVGDVLDFLS